MEPVRVLIVSTNMDRGGAETLIMNIYRCIDRSKVQFDFILHCTHKSAYEDEIASLGGRIYRLPPYRIYNELSYRKAFRDFFKSHPEYKIIHAHIYNSASVFLDEANKCGLHTIAHSHNTSNGKGPGAWIRNYVHRNLYRIAEYRFACSNQAGLWLYRGKADFKVIKNGIDTQRFSFNEKKREEGRNSLGLSPDTILIGHIGRFETAKNHSFLIDVFKDFHSKHPESALVLVGSGSLEDEIKTKIASLNIHDSVIFTGVRHDVDKLLCAMDVFIFPSLYEGFPVTLVEAQCTGVPCVVSDIITDELNLTDLMTKISLSESVETWSYGIEKRLTNTRNNCSQTVRNKGYEIKDIATDIQNFYLDISGLSKS